METPMEISISIPWKQKWKSYGNPMEIQWDSNRNANGNANGNQMEIPETGNVNLIGILMQYKWKSNLNII